MDNSSIEQNKVVLSLDEDTSEDVTKIVSNSEEELVVNDNTKLNEHEIEKNEMFQGREKKS